MTTFKSHFPSKAPFPKVTIAQFLASNPYNIDLNTVVQVDALGTRTKTFASYNEDIKIIASGLRYCFSSLLEPQDIVSIFSHNTFDYPSLVLGVSGAGVVPAPISPASGPEEVEHALRIVDGLCPKVIFCHPDLYNTLQTALQNAHFPRRPVIVSTLDEGARSGQLTVNDIFDLGRKYPRPLATLDGRDPTKTLAVIYYSSGTTGNYKGVMLSHMNLVSNCLQGYYSPDCNMGRFKKILSFLPLYHSFGIITTIVQGPVVGCTIYMLDHFDFEVFLQCIEKYKIEYANIVPPLAVLFAKSPLVDKYDLSSFKHFLIAAAPTKTDLVNQIRKRLNVSVCQGYGLTETSPSVSNLDLEDQHIEGSVGRLLPDIEARIIGADGEIKGPNEEGELILRGPNMFMGYVNNPEATKEVLVDGWLHTGDVAKINEDGYMWIVDRIKELIKVRGFQVPPAELEALLLSHPKVLDCAVTAWYDDSKATELPRAFVVVDPPNRNDATVKELTDFVASKVAYYKQIKGGIFYLDAIPKNPSGKILRRKLPKDIGPPPAEAKL